MLKLENIIIREESTKEQVIEYLLNFFEENGYNGVLQEILGNRNALKNSLYAVNSYCNSILSKRYNAITNECVYEPSEDIKNKIENIRSRLIDLSYYVFVHNTDKEKEYLNLKNIYTNNIFKISELYKELSLLKSKKEYLKKSEELETLQQKVRESENDLDLFVMSNLK